MKSLLNVPFSLLSLLPSFLSYPGNDKPSFSEYIINDKNIKKKKKNIYQVGEWYIHILKALENMCCLDGEK